MSGPPRLQVQARGAFFSRANVLRVMGPAQGARLRILAPARLGHEALALGSTGLEAQAVRLPAAEVGPPGLAETPAAAVGLGRGLPAAGRLQQPTPTRVRGGAGRG